MRKQFIQGMLTGLAAVVAGGAVIALLVMKLGLVPVNADRQPPALEARLIGMALRASVARYAEERPNPLPATEANLSAGAEIYTEMCAKCHGKPNAGPSVYGASFYPPAPQLAAHPPEYTDAELFWIVKHGIRNTAMPAWGRQLSDENIWQVVAFLKRPNSFSTTSRDFTKCRVERLAYNSLPPFPGSSPKLASDKAFESNTQSRRQCGTKITRERSSAAY